MSLFCRSFYRYFEMEQVGDAQQAMQWIQDVTTCLDNVVKGSVVLLGTMYWLYTFVGGRIRELFHFADSALFEHSILQLREGAFPESCVILCRHVYMVSKNWTLYSLALMAVEIDTTHHGCWNLCCFFFSIHITTPKFDGFWNVDSYWWSSVYLNFPYHNGQNHDLDTSFADISK